MEPPAAAKRAMAFAAFALGCRGVILYSYYDLFLAYSPKNIPYPNRTRASEEVVARRLSDLKLLGQEVRALETVLLGDVVDPEVLLSKEQLPSGVVVGLRCPAGFAGGSCTMLVVNTTPKEHIIELEQKTTEQKVTAATTLAGMHLAPFGVTVLDIPRP